MKGISERKAIEIAEQVEEKADMRKAMMFLQKYGISQTLGVKIYQQYKQDMYRILKENPYKMAEDINGIGFKMADEIASRIGIHTDSDYRIRSGLLYILLLATGEGHVYLPKKLLLERAQQLLGVQADYMEKHLTDLSIDRKIVIKEIETDHTGKQQVIYASQYYQIELHTAQMLHDLNVKDTAEEGVLQE